MTSTTTTAAALLQAILEDPDDDLPRLLLADVLEEEAGGFSPRAEFIRVQVELARLRKASFEEMRLALVSGHHAALLEREGRALAPGRLDAWKGVEGLRHFGNSWAPNRYQGCPIWWNRGFIAAVECLCEDWIAHGQALVRAHSVCQVVLSDKRPHFDMQPFSGFSPRLRWHSEVLRGHRAEHLLPDPIFTALPENGRRNGWSTDATALTALSAAAIAWAKAQAEGTA